MVRKIYKKLKGKKVMNKKKFWIILIIVAIAVAIGVFMKMSLVELSPNLG